MKIHFSLPKNEDFFSNYASLTPTLTKLGYMAQVINSVTEFVILYGLIKANLEDFFPVAAGPVGLFGAITGTAFIEIGLRRFIPYSVRAILFKRFAGLHLVISCFVFIVTLGLILSCGFLSFKGSFDLVEAIAPAPQLATTAKADETAQARKGEALATWQRDSLTIEKRFAPALEATLAKYSARKTEERQKLKSWEARKRAEQTTYSTQKASVKATLAAIQAQQAEEVASLAQDKAQALAKAQEDGKAALALAVNTWQKERGEIEAGNKQAKDKAAVKVARYGGGLRENAS